MKKLTNNKFFTAIFVVTTIILAAVAIFTAYRLYQLREQPVAPNVPPKDTHAFSCQEYDLLIDTQGTVRITNNTTSPQPARDIDLIVNGESIGSFSVPALDPETDAILGGINLPTGDFNWSIAGDILCQGEGDGTTHEAQNCTTFSFEVAASEQTPTPTALPTQTITSTPTPTTPQGGINPTSTPTPTSAQITQTTPTTSSAQTQLPDSGISYPTLALIVLTSVLFLFVLLIAV